MKYLRVTLLLLTVVFVLSAVPTFLLADSLKQTDPAPLPLDEQVMDSSIPPLSDGAPYPFPLITYETLTPTDSPGPDAPAVPVINVWYGTTQNFGQLGTPQPWANILGNVTGATTLSYSLNGGPDRQLTIGNGSTDPNINPQRLAAVGDFNIELPVAELNSGANTVLIKANNGEATQVVTVNYTAGTVWPLPYTADWNASIDIQNVAQVVDGRWVIDDNDTPLDPSDDELQLFRIPDDPNNPDDKEIVFAGYDRLVTLGSLSWTDYEVEVPVTVHAVNPSINGSGVGIIARWTGHFDNDGNGNPDDQNPRMGWRQLGALGWYTWDKKGTAGFEMIGRGGPVITSRSDQAIELDVPYIFKLSVQSSSFAGNTATYRFKYWPAAEDEPPQWFMTGTGNLGEPTSGSVVLVAHQADVSFGDTTVRPIANKTFTIEVEQPANGAITVVPQEADGLYDYGQTVEIRVQGTGSNVLKNWLYSFSGNENPLIFDITENIKVGAVMEAGTKPKLTVTPAGQGTVSVSPTRVNDIYFYGEEVTLTPKPNPGSIFAGWGGDHSGADNPAVIVMDKAKNITANFISANPDSPVSDDFNTCVLDEDLWDFIDPVGDGDFVLNGTQLRLVVPAGPSHNIWSDGNRSVRVMQPTQNVNFEIITKFDSVVNQRYQMQGVLVEQDNRNYLRFETHYDGTHIKLYVARFKNGNPTAIINNVLLPATPPYMRITRVGPLWGVSYSYDGAEWIAAGSFNFELAVTRSGVFGGNHATAASPAHTAIVDYFFNSASPIVPGDGPTAAFKVTVTKEGQGSVTLNPPKATYACGEQVTLTAVPASGWFFGSWSGDLAGTSPSQQLTITGNHAVTATFTQEPINEDRELFLPIIVRQ